MFVKLWELLAAEQFVGIGWSQKAVHACMIRLLTLGPAKHEKVAIYVVNQRISNVYRIAGAALQRSNS